jgi:hypothetical protein
VPTYKGCFDVAGIIGNRVPVNSVCHSGRISPNIICIQAYAFRNIYHRCLRPKNFEDNWFEGAPNY